MGSYTGSAKIQEDYVAVDAAADIDKMGLERGWTTPLEDQA